ncbi:hypothetical protein KI387_037204, partial [Taxus chinensis]
YDDECDEAFEGEEVLTQNKKRARVKRGFRDEWKVKFKWLRCAMHEGKTVMKCIYCEEHKSIGPWGTGT